MRSLYATLGVEKSSTAREIKRAYYALAHQHHPDKAPNDAQSAQKFHEISFAYTVLGDPAARKRYDLLGPMALGLSPSFTDLSALGFGPDAERLAQAFSDVVGGMMARLRRSKSPKPKRMQVIIDVATALRGGTREIRVPSVVACPACNGKQTQKHPSTTTAVTGQCPTCQGKGTLAHTVGWSLKIPAGCGPNDVLRMAGAGPRGQDLDCHIKITAHPILRCRNLDVYMDFWLSPGDATCGGTVACTLPHKVLQVEVSPATQAGDVLVLAGEGLKGQGALHLTVEIEIPTAMADEAQRLWLQMRAMESRTPECFPKRLAQTRALQS
jgi:molecular chaperone DnaJ